MKHVEGLTLHVDNILFFLREINKYTEDVRFELLALEKKTMSSSILPSRERVKRERAADEVAGVPSLDTVHISRRDGILDMARLEDAFKQRYGDEMVSFFHSRRSFNQWAAAKFIDHEAQDRCLQDAEYWYNSCHQISVSTFIEKPNHQQQHKRLRN